LTSRPCGVPRSASIIWLTCSTVVCGSRPTTIYPPFNVERRGEDAYRISLAVAGFGMDDITVTAERDTLIIEGKKPDAEAREYLYHGIAARPFRRVFNLADHVQVRQASFRDGLLIVDLVREIPEAMKPRQIPIGNAGSSRQIEQKAA
jgi:molecular chaperone IbpA